MRQSTRADIPLPQDAATPLAGTAHHPAGIIPTAERAGR